jgi:hypothetical protein
MRALFSGGVDLPHAGAGRYAGAFIRFGDFRKHPIFAREKMIDYTKQLILTMKQVWRSIDGGSLCINTEFDST